MMFVSWNYFAVIVSFWDLILNSLKCMCLWSLLQYRRLSVMSCSSSGDCSRHEPWRKATVKVAPQSQLLESFRRLKIIQSGVANPTPTSQPGGPGYHFSSESTPLTCPYPSSSYTTPAISFTIILFFLARSVQCLIGLTASFVILLCPWFWICLSC